MQPEHRTRFPHQGGWDPKGLKKMLPGKLTVFSPENQWLGRCTVDGRNPSPAVMYKTL